MSLEATYCYAILPPDNKSWQAKYNIVLAPRGNIDTEFQDWIRNLLEVYDFFLFEGGLASCSDSVFRTVFPCAFVEREQAETAMRARDAAAIDRHFARPNAGAVERSSDVTGATTSKAYVFGAASVSSRIAQSDAIVPPTSADEGGEPSAKRACNVSTQLCLGGFRRIVFLNVYVSIICFLYYWIQSYKCTI